MPVLPAITDHPKQLERLVKAVAERRRVVRERVRRSGCDRSARARYLPFIEKEFPHLAKRYRATYAFDHQVSATYTDRLRETMRALCEKHGVGYGRLQSEW